MKMYKFVQINQFCSVLNLRSPELLDTFFQDGTIYFLLTFCIVLICTIFINVQKLLPWYLVPYNWQMTAFSQAGSRLILNLRTVARGKGDVLSFINQSDISGLRIASESAISAPSFAIEMEDRYGRRENSNGDNRVW
ncbi:unnamed protein product [Somion occarium]|uniref:ATP synthase F0 subunit 8 n=1 Tax=Somion occarium TaxID=3059160 RepID=A0ABP1DTI6_9APHY